MLWPHIRFHPFKVWDEVQLILPIEWIYFTSEWIFNQLPPTPLRCIFRAAKNTGYRPKPGAQQNGPGAQTAPAWSYWCSRRASWRPRRPPAGPPGAPGAKDGLWTDSFAPKTASGRISWRPNRHRRPWRPKRPLDGSPGAQNGLWTGLLAPKTAFGRARRPLDGPTGAQDASWRPRRPLDGPPGAQGGLWTGLLTPSRLSTPLLVCRFYSACMTTLLTRHLSDELGNR